MNCDLCHALIQQRLDGEETVDSLELEHHLSECSRCAALHAASCRLSAGLRLLPLPPLPLDFTNRLVAEVLVDQQTQRQWTRLVASALAASLLVGGAAMGLYSFGWVSFGMNKPSPSVVEIRPTPPPLEVKSTAAPSMRETMTDAGNALATLTTRTADETVGQTRLLVPMVTGPSLDELDRPPALEPTKSYLEAGQGVSVALEPVTNSARRAVDLFRRDLPRVERTSKP